MSWQWRSTFQVQLRQHLQNDFKCGYLVILASNISRKTNSLVGTLGLIHAGVQIGKIRLDWYADGLVHVRDLGAKSSLENPIAVIPPDNNKGIAKDAKNFRTVSMYCNYR